MKILTGRTLPEPCVLAVGKFESIHRGHRALIQNGARLAREKGIASAVVAFTPHPYRVLGMGHEAYKPLFTRYERAFLLGGLEVDYLLEYPFDDTLISLPPEAFGQIIFEQLRAETVLVGEGYRFGHNREGTVHTLRELAAQYGRRVEIAQKRENISTSKIRALLNSPAPQLDEAAAFLGFPFFALDETAPGRRLGHSLGFPTLNLYPPPEKFLPRFGVYTTRTTINGQSFPGVTNIGLRPTVHGNETAPTIETHLFGFNEDAYGREIHVAFLHFMRDEKKFPSLDALRAQIGEDVRKVGLYFERKSAEGF
ncbi:MAG: riboflavin biosynthesis protein RibF [Defluviitaleaceae bacterium]|nr:riboflavin biosynthesis protein RibF [Defluviitaleaceae bacterium]MCL2240568.1 riboflavin biosynthesis protein RibF [Defluviitaleaceae bacterium]